MQEKVLVWAVVALLVQVVAEEQVVVGVMKVMVMVAQREMLEMLAQVVEEVAKAAQLLERAAQVGTVPMVTQIFISYLLFHLMQVCLEVKVVVAQVQVVMQQEVGERVEMVELPHLA
jgi:hypothetical protein